MTCPICGGIEMSIMNHEVKCLTCNSILNPGDYLNEEESRKDSKSETKVSPRFRSVGCNCANSFCYIPVPKLQKL